MRTLELERYAKKYNIPIMQKDGIAFIEEYIKKNKIRKILEIGTAIGYSAIRMALINKNIKIITIERDIDRYNEAMHNINKFGLTNQVQIILGDALTLDVDGTFDMLFIDGAKSQYIKFLEKFNSNLIKESVVITDNLSFHGIVEDESKTSNRNTKQLVRKIKNYINYLKDNDNFNTTFYDIGDGISVSIKK